MDTVNTPISSELLSSKYSDRWNILKNLMKSFPNDTTLPTCKLRQGEKNPAIKFNFQLEDHEYINLAYDTHIIDSSKAPYYAEETFELPYTMRKKIYISDKNIGKYDNYLNDGGIKNKDYEYFLEMYKDFKPIMERYYNTQYKDVQDKYEFWPSLMAVEYACPFATPETAIEQRSNNTNIWGPSHADETLGGLHLGEDVQEFQASYTGQDGEYNYVPGLTDNHYMFFYGEESVQYNHIPTFHRMIPHPTNPSSTRYSIIIDLDAREK